MKKVCLFGFKTSSTVHSFPLILDWFELKQSLSYSDNLPTSNPLRHENHTTQFPQTTNLITVGREPFNINCAANIRKFKVLFNLSLFRIRLTSYMFYSNNENKSKIERLLNFETQRNYLVVIKICNSFTIKGKNVSFVKHEFFGYSMLLSLKITFHSACLLRV